MEEEEPRIRRSSGGEKDENTWREKSPQELTAAATASGVDSLRSSLLLFVCLKSA